MIYLRFIGNGHVRYGILSGKIIHEITPNYFTNFKKSGRKYRLSKVRLLPPCEPTKIIALGLNYLDHAKELRMPIPFEPLLFLKAPTAVIGTEENIVYPKSTNRLDFEAELAIVIKKKAKNIPIKKAKDYILGYTCLNDVTARDLQSQDGQWARAKSFDTFAPMGPWIVSDINPNNLDIEAYINRKCKQYSNTKELIFKVEEIVYFTSKIMTLLPGDVISTGTPPGVGPMSKGDTVKIKIEKIGTLVNRVVR
ncbi:MAG: fumarylacetoacetate hydrolase family protein [Endomicrobiales bacterium]|nr:fumarylacetoacetate hydrolase family protein [Endomicrobiales bacterium]